MYCQLSINTYCIRNKMNDIFGNSDKRPIVSIVAFGLFAIWVLRSNGYQNVKMTILLCDSEYVGKNLPTFPHFLF